MIISLQFVKVADTVFDYVIIILIPTEFSLCVPVPRLFLS